MFAINDLTKPWSARTSRVSFARVTRISSSAFSTVISSGNERCSSPLGPFTVIVWPVTLTCTPDGTGMGACPTRDISSFPLSPHVGQDFAAYLRLARLPVGHEPLRGRDDRNAEAAQHARQLLGASIHAPARLRYPADPGDHPLALVGVAQADLDHGVPVVRRDLVGIHVAL